MHDQLVEMLAHEKARSTVLFITDEQDAVIDETTLHDLCQKLLQTYKACKYGMEHKRMQQLVNLYYNYFRRDPSFMVRIRDIERMNNIINYKNMHAYKRAIKGSNPRFSRL